MYRPALRTVQLHVPLRRRLPSMFFLFFMVWKSSVLYRIVPYHTLPHFTLYHTVPYLTMYHAVPHLTIYHTVPYFTVPYLTVPLSNTHRTSVRHATQFLCFPLDYFYPSSLPCRAVPYRTVPYRFFSSPLFVFFSSIRYVVFTKIYQVNIYIFSFNFFNVVFFYS